MKSLSQAACPSVSAHGVFGGNCCVPLPESPAAATDLDLISFLRSIPVIRMRRGIRIRAWTFLLVTVLGILSGCRSLRDLERLAFRHHIALTGALGIELRRPPSDLAFRYFFPQMDVALFCGAIRDWTITQIPGGVEKLDQLVCDGKTMRVSTQITCSGRSTYGLWPTASTLPKSPSTRRHWG